MRDLLRKRLMLVRQRTSHILSFENHIARNTRSNISSNKVKKMNPEDVELLLDNKHLVLSGEINIEAIRFLDEQIKKIEKAVLAEAKLKEPYEYLLTVPGIGKILALTIMFETGNIKRFPKEGNYSSYCRCVKSERRSNDKKKGRGNSRNGNEYLGWAYVEAANFMRRYCPEANSFYQKKSARTNKIVATKALANKTARACYYIIRDQKPFDVKRMFGNRKGCGSEPDRSLDENHLS